MKKQWFLGAAGGVLVLLLILAFQNVFVSAPYAFLLYRGNISTTFLILFAGLLGFFLGFFFMLWAFEHRKEKESLEAQDFTAPPIDPVATPASLPKKEKTPPEMAPSPSDHFDEDDEVLG